MGARFGHECFADALAAARAQCAATSGVTSAGFQRCTGVAGSASEPVLQLSTQPATGAALTSTAAAVYDACDPMEAYQDISAMFGLFILAAVPLFMFRHYILQHLLPQ